VDGPSGPHVLVMNDEQAIIDVIKMLLEEEGYRVSTSTYLLDLDKIRRLNPDALVLDIMFEGESKGWPFITMARIDREVSKIPILLCTAAVTTVMPMLDRLAAQRIRVVYKPFDIDELLVALRDALNGAFLAKV
jgi:DNA-binding response OmpR family regulator